MNRLSARLGGVLEISADGNKKFHRKYNSMDGRRITTNIKIIDWGSSSSSSSYSARRQRQKEVSVGGEKSSSFFKKGVDTHISLMDNYCTRGQDASLMLLCCTCQCDHKEVYFDMYCTTLHIIITRKISNHEKSWCSNLWT